MTAQLNLATTLALTALGQQRKRGKSSCPGGPTTTNEGEAQMHSPLLVMKPLPKSSDFGEIAMEEKHRFFRFQWHYPHIST